MSQSAVEIFRLNASAIWLVNKIPCRNSPKRTCRPCDFTMKINSMGHNNIWIYIVKRNTETDGMCSFEKSRSIWTHLKNITVIFKYMTKKFECVN